MTAHVFVFLVASNMPKKIKSFQDLWGGGDFEQQMENMSEHEKYALMLSDHTPTTWGAEEEVSVPHNIASVNAWITVIITSVVITLMVISDYDHDSNHL